MYSGMLYYNSSFGREKITILRNICFSSISRFKFLIWHEIWIQNFSQQLRFSQVFHIFISPIRIDVNEQVNIMF